LVEAFKKLFECILLRSILVMNIIITTIRNIYVILLNQHDIFRLYCFLHT
jgi:hypothetical protein